jgi:Uma2 family endonuclease
MATVPVQRHTRRGAPAARPTAERLSVCIPVTVATLGGFRAWATSDAFPEHLRAAFIDGEIYLDMSNEDPECHVGVKGETSRVLSTLTRERKLGKFYHDGVLISNEEAVVSNNPDASFLSSKTLRSGKARVVPREGRQGVFAEIVGTPDWVLEVVSDSSVIKDTERLRMAYHRAGIREYWLIDARGEQLVFQVLHWRKRGYVAAPMKEGWQQSRVFGCWFRLERQRDEFGLWEFTLAVREE